MGDIGEQIEVVEIPDPQQVPLREPAPARDPEKVPA